MKFKRLTTRQAEEFYRLSRLYWKEALRCESSKAYLAGVIMIGAALETLLTLMVYTHADQAVRSGKVPMHRASGKAKDLLEWRFADLLAVAKAANWLPAAAIGLRFPWHEKGAKIGDYAELVRVRRNLIHPAAFLRLSAGGRITATTLRTQFEIALICRDWLVTHNNKRLVTRLARQQSP